MRDKQKRKKIRQYFQKTSYGWSFFLILAGGAAIVFDVIAGADGVLAIGGLVLAAIGGIMFLSAAFKSLSRPSDTTIDKWFEEDLQQIHKHAVHKLGLGEELLGVKKEPLRAIGPIWWSDSGVPKQDLLYKQGKDGVTRYSVYEVLLIYTAEHLLAAYSCDFNTLKNVMLNEATYEFHYQDIVSVATRESSTSYTLPNKEKLVDSQEFSVSVSSGESIGVVIKSDKLVEITKGEMPFKDEVENTINRLRSLLRDKKQPVAPPPTYAAPVQSAGTPPIRADEVTPSVSPPTESGQSVPSAAPPVAGGITASPPDPTVVVPEQDTPAASPPSGSDLSPSTPDAQPQPPDEEEVFERYCSNCGTKLSPDNRFCPGCGRKLKS